jgi:hypothetical protein|tara:strand:+ start:636 stop:902 length:267 start_codon:yes stop_codon:yes gene_type:complete
VTEIPDRLKERKGWTELLNAAWMYHRQLVKETQPEIIGQKASEAHIFHQAVSVAIKDAVNMIQQMEAFGYFDDEQDEENILSKPGPAG